jgi:hypothetical protein
VTCRSEGIVRQTLEGITNIEDDICGPCRLDAVEDTRLCLILKLQSADGVLKQHCDGAKVGVLGDAGCRPICEL